MNKPSETMLVCKGSFASVRVCPLSGHCGREFLRQGRDGPTADTLGLVVWSAQRTVVRSGKEFPDEAPASPPRNTVDALPRHHRPSVRHRACGRSGSARLLVIAAGADRSVAAVADRC